MARKTSKGKPLLGDNPFGDISTIDIPPKPKKTRPAGGKKQKAASRRKETAPVRGAPKSIISEAEKKIDEVLETMSAQRGGDGHAQDALLDFASRMQTRMASIQVEAGEEKQALATLLKLIRPSFYLKKFAPLLLACKGIETDEFGMDETFEENIKPLLKLLYDKYWRISATGLDNVPPEGGCIVVANHAPVLSLDGMMLRYSIVSRVRPDARWLTENELFYIPYVGTLAQRVGAVRASQENATTLLDKGGLIITFPEGIQGISKTFRERYTLKRFGRGGYIRLAIRHCVPIIPAAIVGPQDSFPILWKMTAGARQLSLPFIPVTPTFPLLGPLGLIPLPLKWKIIFGSPVTFDYPKNAKPDQATINKLNNTIRDSIAQMIQLLREG
ncbi:MAG: lysophospholipid acyltransferase family protein [Pseudomonadota bacterium]